MLPMVFKTILAMSATGGILLLLISLLRPVTTRAFSAAWNYRVSLIVLVFLLIPIGFVLGRIFMDIHPGLVVHPMETSIISLDDMQDDTVKTITDMGLPQAYQRTEYTFHVHHLLYYLFWAWLLGMLIFIAYKGTEFLKFKRKLLETSLPVEQDSSIYQIYQECRLNLGIRQKISLLCNDSIKTPMVTGLFKTCIIMPKVDMDKRELKFIFHHELLHCKRKDLWFKAAALFANAVHWFNPLVYRMVYDINEYCEISCDEAVVRDMSIKERHCYGETILNVLSRVINKQEGLYSNLCESEKGIKRRLTLIMKKKDFSKKTIAISIAILIVVCMIGSALAYMLTPSNANLAEDSNWKTSLDEIDSKTLFADMVTNNKIEVDNADNFQSAIEQFLSIVAQNQKTVTEEKDIEALTVPVPDGRITSTYGERVHPVKQERKFHTGVDYAQKTGGDIIAANTGKVIATHNDLGGSEYYGNYLIIVHNDGTACLYAHCSALVVNTGDWVNKGDKIAEIGSTGMATGPHCHFEFRINGKAVNPIPHIAVPE